MTLRNLASRRFAQPAPLTSPSHLLPEDAARLHMGLPENPMVINAALVLDGQLPHAELRALVEQRLLLHPRFRQRVVEPRLGMTAPRWAEDRSFDLRHHLETALSWGSLEELLGSLASTPLDRKRPLWKMVHVTDVPGGDVLVVRVHHCVADGLHLLDLLTGIADDRAPEIAPAAPAPSERMHALRRALRVLAALRGAGRLVLERAEPKSRLRGELGVRKATTVSGPLPLEALLRAARGAGATLNDLLLSAVTSALREHLRDHDDAIDVALHAFVPVSLEERAHGRAPRAGNRFTSVLVPLPMHVSDAQARVIRLHEELARQRSRGAAHSGSSLVRAAGSTFAFIEQLGVRLFSRRATVMVSDVKGPTKPVHLGGVAVRDLFAWAPAPGSVPLAVTLISYAGHVRIGVLADARVVGNPAQIVRRIEQELSDWCRRA